VAGVTGADLKRRIEAILSQRMGRRLNGGKKVLLAGAGVLAFAVPVVSGFLIHAEDAAAPKFEVASIRPCVAEPPRPRGRKKEGGSPSPDRLRMVCQPLEALIEWSYGVYADAHFHINPSWIPILGGPAWIHSTKYEINAKAAAPQTVAVLNGPMLQTLLKDRFQLRIHREIKTAPVYALTVSKSGAKLQPFQEGSCIAVDWDHPPPLPPPGPTLPKWCGMGRVTNTGLYGDAVTLADVCQFFSNILDRPVIDQTGITGTFNIHLDLSAADLGHPAPDAAPTDPSTIYAAVNGAMHKLGLKMESTKGPKEFLVVDSAERPSEN
jgi:bla regulator protein blaR1